MKFSKLFLNLRKELNLTQVQMSKRLKITQGKLSKIEKGKCKPSAMDFIRAYRLTGGGMKIWGAFAKVLGI